LQLLPDPPRGGDNSDDHVQLIINHIPRVPRLLWVC
jgi:hypothetical protein